MRKGMVNTLFSLRQRHQKVFPFRLIGFTLIELIMFIAITGFAVLILTPLMVTLRASKVKSERLRSIELAQQCMELNLNKKSQVGFSDFVVPVPCSLPAGFYAETLIQLNWPTKEGNKNYKTIQVNIKEKEGVGRMLTSLTTLVTDY